MKLSQLIQALRDADRAVEDDPDVVLCFEPGAMEEGFSWASTEGISDVRVTAEWPLPGESMLIKEHEKPSKVVIFYDNHFNLDSAES
jgi:Pyruvate/2-oxoacid:ferredoxin oxidoreductase gamma subunit